jgi:acyl carrier protein
MTDKDPKALIRGFLEKDLGLDLSSVSNDSPLFTSGTIDSFALLELMSFMEAEFGAKIDITDLSIEQLDTIDALVALC